MEPADRPKRRPRYRGTHPRRFAEKYKEHQPEKYPETFGKVLASGKTPAGTHRPVLLDQVLESLQPEPGQFGVDCTVGYGGHARAILERVQPGGFLLALDKDPIELEKTELRLREAGFGPEILQFAHRSYAGLTQLLAERGPADFILADLGVSSMQLDNPERGFSYKSDGPLDLRLNPRHGKPASAWLQGMAKTKLERLLLENADEPRAAEIAAALAKAQAEKPIRSTLQLRAVVERLLGVDHNDLNATLARVFQALRILVNDEFSALDSFLHQLPACLKPGGRAVVLTFHSGEDRRVKQAFKEGVRQGLYDETARRVVTPGPEELRDNPRASCAKLRWAVRTAE